MGLKILLPLLAGLGIGAAAVAAVPATQVESFQYLTDKQAADKLPATRNGFAGAALSDHENFREQLALRDKSGTVEQHTNWNDYMVVQEGEATLTYGGTSEGAKEVAPGELRGTSISGGQIIHLHAGDIITIPAGMPHLTEVDPNKRFRYVVFKSRF